MPMTPTPPIIVATGEVGIDNAPQVPAVGAREPTGEALEIAVPAPFTIAAVPTVMLAIAHVPAAIMIEDCLLLGAESGIEDSSAGLAAFRLSTLRLSIVSAMLSRSRAVNLAPALGIAARQAARSLSDPSIDA